MKRRLYGDESIDVIAIHRIDSLIYKTGDLSFVLRIPPEAQDVEAMKECGETTGSLTVAQIDGINPRCCELSRPLLCAYRQLFD